MIPLLKFEVFIGVNNTYWGLILPYAAYSLPFGIFVMAAFIRTIPVDIEEAGMLDGCNKLQTIWHILLPISRPGFATVFIFTFMAIWNEFVIAMIIIQNQNLNTLNLGLLSFKRSYGSIGMEPNLMFAGLVMIAAPMIIVYTIFQKQFISGLIAGSMKS
jgi:ABC-type glycerol-3-phosphate transport system permease component